MQFAGPGPKDKFMLVSPDDSCELFYRARKVEEDKASITIEYLDLPSSAVSSSTLVMRTPHRLLMLTCSRAHHHSQQHRLARDRRLVAGACITADGRPTHS